MPQTRPASVALLLFGVAAVFSASPTGVLRAQDPPTRREFTISAREFRFSPDRLEVVQDDLVKLTIRSEDIAYSFTIDEYRVSRRVPAGRATTFEFRAERPGTFAFYSNLSSDEAHARMRGTLVVRAR